MKISPLATVALAILSLATPVSTECVVGGKNVNATEYPFVVQGQSKGQGCIASLIWYDVALSSARCYGDAFNHGVLIGNIIANNVTSGVIARNVSRQVKHLKWKPFTPDYYDFLALKLSAEVPRNHSFIKPIDINNVTKNPANKDALTIVAFGMERNNGLWVRKLQKNTLYSNCSSPLPGMLCASNPTLCGCFGNTGGPLIDARGVLVGITSRGPFTCDSQTYFARVSREYPWIRSQICLLASDPPAYCPTVILTNNTIMEGESTTITLTNPELGPLTGRVDWGDGSVSSGTNVSFTHQYLNGDTNYTIKTNFSHSALPTPKQYKEFYVFVDAVLSMVISVIPNPPQADPLTRSISIAISHTDPSATYSLDLFWDINSGRESRSLSLADSYNLTFTHKYPGHGEYEVSAGLHSRDPLWERTHAYAFLTI